MADIPRTLGNGRYEVVRRIGAGGMGTVYAAIDREAGNRRVAIKTRIGGGDVDYANAMFMREARMMRQLSSADAGTDSVVQVYDVFVEDNTVHIVQELVERGHTLTEWQRNRPVAELLGAYSRLLDVVDRIHSMGLVHRDLKPQNVMLEPVGSGYRLVIMDLGLTVGVGAADSLTGPGHMVGTVTYMSPETVEGSPVGAPADVFAVGVMLFEAVTGRLPWRAESVSILAVHILRDDPDFDDAVRLVPVQVVNLIRAMLRKSPAERPTARECADTLTRFTQPWQSPERTASSPAPGGPSRVGPGYVPASKSAHAPRRWNTHSLLTMAALGLLVAIAIWAALVTQVRSALGTMLLSIALFSAGGVVVWRSLLAVRKARRIDVPAPLVDRITALESKVVAASQLTQTLAVNVTDVSRQLIDPDRLEEVIRQSVIVALKQLQPATGPTTPELNLALGVIAELSRKPMKPNQSISERLSKYVGVAGGVVTISLGSVTFMNSVNLWRPNRQPQIADFSSEPGRIRQGASVMIRTNALDADGDDLTYAHTADVGSFAGSGPSVMWIPPATSVNQPVVHFKVVVSDGRSTTSHEMSVPVNRPPQGRVVAQNGPVARGRILQFVAQFIDSDGDTLSYEWTVSGGTLLSSNRDVLLWRAPSQAAEVTVMCRASDGTESTVATATVNVQ